MKRLLLFGFTVMVFQFVPAQKNDKFLEAKINHILEGFHGKVGVYVHDLRKNRFAAVQADTIFPTASMVKIPILTGIMQKISTGELQYHQEMVYKDSLLYPGVDILGSLQSGTKIELSKVMLLMLSLSDNTASLWLQSLAGTGTRINELMDSLGLRVTRVNSRTPGRESNRNQYGWGQTSPYEMAALLEKIVNKQVINTETSEKMLRLLGRNYWDEEAVSQIPSDVFVASKNGAVDASRSEVVYVKGKKANYLFCICTKDNQDTSWTAHNEAWDLTRKLSKMLWEYYQ